MMDPENEVQEPFYLWNLRQSDHLEAGPWIRVLSLFKNDSISP
jgi:hypothetical protein